MNNKQGAKRIAFFFAVLVFIAIFLTSIYRAFASAQDSRVIDTQTEFNSGTYINTTISGNESVPSVNLQSLGGKKELTFNNSGGALTDYQILIDEGEVGYWKMDEASGTSVADSSGNGINGVAIGANVVSGRHVNARELIGNLPYIQVPGAQIGSLYDFNDKVTLSTWIKTSKTTDQYILTKTENSFYLNVGNQSSGKVSFYINGVSGGWLTGNTFVSDNQWHHIVAVYDGTKKYIYVDGVLDVSANSPMSTEYSNCGFILPNTIGEDGRVYFDLSNVSFHGDQWLTTSQEPYYLNISAIDNAERVTTDIAQFMFRYDETPPDNILSTFAQSGNFSNINDMYFTWQLTANDEDSLVLGYQYQINSFANDWKGTENNAFLDIEYIPVSQSTHYLSVLKDNDEIVLGNNTVYFRTVDFAGNFSSPQTYRTTNLAYGGSAPTFGGDGIVQISPQTSESNLFSLNWPEATPTIGRTIVSYYYMVNTPPPSNLSTLKGNSSVYISTGLERSVPNVVLSGVNKGSNVIYVVAVDDNSNYSPSNKIIGNFNLNSTNPDPVINLSVNDASIKSQSLWRGSLVWNEPVYKGTGMLTYIIQRSENGINWVEVSKTTGLSQVDIVSQSKQYYWRVGSIDGSDSSIASPSYTNGVTLTPKGRFSEAANLVTDPNVVNIGSKKATINWVTDRKSDSRISYGTNMGEYFPEEVANSDQLIDHSIGLTNLDPGTIYYYKVSWTDEDGNIGQSIEKTFTTNPSPEIIEVNVRELGLYNATVNFKVKGASRVILTYGKDSLFGNEETINTSTDLSEYSIRLSRLDDGSQYQYKFRLIDSEGNSFPTLASYVFSTPFRPKISNVRIQQVKNSVNTMVQVSWDSNTDISSIISYYPNGYPEDYKNTVDLKLVKGSHKMNISNLLPEMRYAMYVKGFDSTGNEAVSEIQLFTTAIDTRSPLITNLTAEGENSNYSGTNGDSGVQLVVSWTTDEPATSKVQFGEGTGTSYSNTTFEENTLSQDHIVILPNLIPSKVYHLSVISKDKAGNSATSYDIVVVTPPKSESALELILNSLNSVFR